jgi:hypothetical protein
VFVTSQGSPRHQFQRAIERGSPLDAIAAAKTMGRLTLGDALALCVVLADHDPTRYPRAAARWVARFALEEPDVTLEETQLVAAALAALATCPQIARPVLREFARVRQLVTVQSVFEDFVVVQ